jgi:hypothetical protein
MNTRRFVVCLVVLFIAVAAFADQNHNYAGEHAGKALVNARLTGFAKQVVNRINKPNGPNGDAYFIAAGTGTYRWIDGSPATQFKWVAFQNSDGLFSIEFSMRLPDAELKKIAALRDIINRPYEARFDGANGVTALDLSNDWAFTKEDGDKKTLPFCTGHNACSMPRVVDYYLSRITAQVSGGLSFSTSRVIAKLD